MTITVTFWGLILFVFLLLRSPDLLKFLVG